MLDKRIHLKPINQSDTENILIWRNNESVIKNFIFQEKLTTQMHQNWLETMVETKKVYQFIIVENETNKPLGSVYLRDVDMQNKKAEFGIFIGEESARGKGYGLEATKLILEFGFKELSLNKIFLRVFEKNQVAIKSYEKAGFKREGLFLQDVFINGEFQNIVFMAIFKGDA
jgi:UDP-4-amino-4,6-dideoxy-N-acetyl-beta-L-altrosamine N-acetyltransferase